jgi:hypothetical protein
VVKQPKPKFQQITDKLRRELFAANLTSAEWRFWVYLAVLDPFGDTGVEFDPATIMLECGLSKSTYFATKAKFQKLGWFDFKDGRTRFINLNGCARQQSENSELESENSELESENSELESENSELESENSESHIYIDRTGDQTIQTNTNKYRQFQSCVEDTRTRTYTTACSKIEDLEEEEPAQVFSATAPDKNTITLENQNLQLGECSAPPQFSKKMENLVTQLDRGELKDLPADDKKQLANYLMGEQIKLYRRGGWILSVKPNDINPDFLKYVAWKELKQPDDLEWARNTIISYERDMTKWGQLVALIQGWQTVTPEEVSATAIARVASRRGSKEDLEIAIQSSIDGYKTVTDNPFRRKKEAT